MPVVIPGRYVNRLLVCFRALNQRKEQARIVLLKCRALREEDKESRANEDKKQYIKLNESLANMSMQSRPGSAQSMNGSIRESKSKEELDEFFSKIATPIERPGTAPNQRTNDGTLRIHWAHEMRAPPTTWGQLAQQVYMPVIDL